MLCEKLFYLSVAGAFQSRSQFVVSQIGFERIVAQLACMAAIRAAIALGQSALGFVVKLALLLKAGGLSSLKGDDNEEEAKANTGESTAHETSENGGGMELLAASLARPVTQLNAD